MHKILIADDEHNIRHILDFSLHSEGFDVISAGNGEDAFTLAASEIPDLVILDVMMPGQGGIETCRLLKADDRTANIPVILLTARSSREDREEGNAAGADEYITKPFSPQKVIGAVQSVLGVTSS
ncbi:MAG: response regulator [bacterium]|nr:response regulator [bacterium]